ncbi:MAG TPA: hypothetical protein VEI58_00975 [Chthoniobacterales bacterium]|nr:hypothetical protein [Chthoniobacterales bacterium]
MCESSDRDRNKNQYNLYDHACSSRACAVGLALSDNAGNSLIRRGAHSFICFEVKQVVKIPITASAGESLLASTFRLEKFCGMKKLTILAPLFSVIVIILNSCASHPTETSTTTTTSETSVTTPPASTTTTTTTHH